MPGGQENCVSLTFSSWPLVPCCEPTGVQLHLGDLKESRREAAECGKQKIETEVGRQVAFRSPERVPWLGRAWEHGVQPPQRSVAWLSTCLSLDLQICGLGWPLQPTGASPLAKSSESLRGHMGTSGQGLTVSFFLSPSIM